MIEKLKVTDAPNALLSTFEQFSFYCEGKTQGEVMFMAFNKINEVIDEVNKYIPLRDVKEFKANSSKE